MRREKAARKSTGVPRLPVFDPDRQDEAQKSRAEGAARNFKTFVQQMEVYLPGMSASQRKALLKELHTLSKDKNYIESELSSERRGANIAFVFRKYRLWLVDFERELSTAIQAMHRAANVANSCPKLAELNTIDLGEDDLDKNELQKKLVGRIHKELVRALNALEKINGSVAQWQYRLAAATNPKLRTRAEKKLVSEEPKGLTHHLLVGETTPQIDLSFLRDAALILEKYHNKNGEPIRRKGQILAKVFEYALGGSPRTEGSIQRYLSPSRRNLR